MQDVTSSFSEVYLYPMFRPLLAGFDLCQLESHNVIFPTQGKSVEFLHSESLPAPRSGLLSLLLADIVAFSPAGLLRQQPVSKTVLTLHRNQHTSSSAFLSFPYSHRGIKS